MEPTRELARRQHVYQIDSRRDDGVDRTVAERHLFSDDGRDFMFWFDERPDAEAALMDPAYDDTDQIRATSL
ncbi:MAG TPA: hypothetical protein VHP33_32155 [Polyangiaceae bacterium]|nr:hypothetical protein [Polyangiaceae bacterium]